MRPHAFRVLAVLSLVVVLPIVARAQTPTPAAATSIMPPAGTWGIEATYLGGGASLLHFATPSRAWVFGANFDVERESSELPSSPTTTETQSNSTAFASIHAGQRWYSGEPASRVRPLVELGLEGGYGGGSDSHLWQAGAYGNVGAAYFFTPHLSLGGTGALSLTRTESRSSVYSGTIKQHVTRFGGDVARLTAAVYF